jgi:transcriptional regulator with XRE-family HTH domain
VDETPKILTNFGARVRKLRTAKGLSQEAFGNRCNLDRTYISGVERGLRNISFINIQAIAIALEISLSELMDGL